MAGIAGTCAGGGRIGGRERALSDAQRVCAPIGLFFAGRLFRMTGRQFLPFVALMAFAILVLCLVPGLALFLPTLIKG